MTAGEIKDMNRKPKKKTVKAWAVIFNGRIAICHCHCYPQDMFHIWKTKKGAKHGPFKKIVPCLVTFKI